MELLVAASDGRGFVVDGEEAVAQTRAGKQVLTPAEGALARICLPAEGGDAVALSATTAGCWWSSSTTSR